MWVELFVVATDTNLRHCTFGSSHTRSLLNPSAYGTKEWAQAARWRFRQRATSARNAFVRPSPKQLCAPQPLPHEIFSLQIRKDGRFALMAPRPKVQLDVEHMSPFAVCGCLPFVQIICIGDRPARDTLAGVTTPCVHRRRQGVISILVRAKRTDPRNSHFARSVKSQRPMQLTLTFDSKSPKKHRLLADTIAHFPEPGLGVVPHRVAIWWKGLRCAATNTAAAMQEQIRSGKSRQIEIEKVIQMIDKLH